ncbi:uncharacterized protein LOC142163056 [Nicotiana tabacum]|uniref:Uncharacterized protein LOC142163056 n=1 Tax=Nicotiana tabacum TaxID=4097 RepID=A0AC58RUJ5_TOBAC
MLTTEDRLGQPVTTNEVQDFKQCIDNIWTQNYGHLEANFMEPGVSDHSPILIEKEKQNMSDLEKWSTIEERIIRQKSRATWIDHGDSNSKYFYAHLKIRASKNNITFIYNDLGMKITDPKAVEKEFTDFLHI